MAQAEDPAINEFATRRAWAIEQFLAGVNAQAGVAQLAELALNLEEIRALDGPEAALPLLIRAIGSFRVDRRTRQRLLSLYRSCFAECSAEQLTACTLPDQEDDAIRELLRRGHTEHAEVVAQRIRAKAERRANWGLVARVDLLGLQVRRSALTPEQTFAEFVAVHDALPPLAVTARTLVLRDLATFAATNDLAETAIGVLDGIAARTATPHPTLQELLADLHFGTGQRALRDGAYEEAFSHFEPIINGLNREWATRALVRWSEALTRIDDSVFVRAHLEWIVGSPHLSATSRRRMQGRLAVARSADGEDDRALELLRTAYASLSILDDAEYEPLALYARLLEAQGEQGLARWAYERAAIERPVPSTVSRAGVEPSR